MVSEVEVTMTGEAIPRAVRALLMSCLDSYEKLHIVCALSSAGRGLALDDLAKQSSVPRAHVCEALPALLNAGLVVRTGESFAYVAGDAEREAGVASVRALLAQNAVELAMLLNALALERARKAIEARLQVAFGVSSGEAPGDESDPSV